MRLFFKFIQEICNIWIKAFFLFPLVNPVDSLIHGYADGLFF